MSISGLKDYHIPETTSNAVDLLSRYGESALIVAGGTFVHGLAARGLLMDIEAIIDISRLPLSDIGQGKSEFAIGATATYGALAANVSVVNEPSLGAIADALTYPPAQIMNAATIGGSIAASCPLFDLPVALSALEATVNIIGAADRSVAIDDFLVSLFESALKDGEMVSGFSVPSPAPGASSGFVKLETNANDLAIINAAAWVRVREGICEHARIYTGGGVGDTPARAPSVEAALLGKPLTEDVIVQAAKLGKNDITTMTDQRTSAEYRREMIGVMISKALRKAAERLG